MLDGIGEELRQERLRQGLSVDEIARRTRISIRYIEAIDADAFDRLPGVVFTRNFVRLYSLELQLDPDAFVSRLPRVDIEAAPMPTPPSRPGRTAWDPRITAALASVLWLVTAGGAGTGAWYYYNHYGRHLVTTVASAPAPNNAGAVQPSALAPAAKNFDNSRPVQVILTAREVTWVQVRVGYYHTLAEARRRCRALYPRCLQTS